MGQSVVDEVFETVGSQQVTNERLWLLSDQQGGGITDADFRLGTPLRGSIAGRLGIPARAAASKKAEICSPAACEGSTPDSITSGQPDCGSNSKYVRGIFGANRSGSYSTKAC